MTPSTRLDSPALPPEPADLVERVAALSREKFAPRAAQYDEDSSFPFENYQDLREAGALAMTVPAKYGGPGVDLLTYTRCLLEIAKGCPSTALTFNMHAHVISTFLNGLASEEQKRHYFKEALEKGKLFAAITSEPESSWRDRFVVRTRFRPEGDGYRVDGVKHFCSLGDAADYYFVSGLVEGHESAADGILSAVIPREGSGITVERPWNGTGMRATTSHTIRYDTRVTPDQIVGSPGQLFTLDMSEFPIGYAATYLGIADAAFEYIVEYVKTKKLSSTSDTMRQSPLTQRSIGEMATQLRAARLLVYEAATLHGSGSREQVALAVNQAKYLAGEVGTQVTLQAMRMAGGSGFLKDMPLERWHRDSLGGPVMPPAGDRCLETIGRIWCDLPLRGALEFE
ncbi:MAG: acyl-CoA dehydrogenase family protein [Dehalococcoidia bacterium]